MHIYKQSPSTSDIMQLGRLPAFLLLASGILLPVRGICRPDDRFNKFDRKSCQDGFCFDYALTFLITGQFEMEQVLSGNAILDHYALAGFSTSNTIAEARRATVFFFEKYGVDFRGLTDDQLLRGIQLDPVTGATFVPTITNSGGSFRLYLAATRCGFDFLNFPVNEASWVLTFPTDFVSTGTFTDTIPGESSSAFGCLVIEFCPNKGDTGRFCPEILDRRKDPLFIRFTTRTFNTIHPPVSTPFVVINNDIQEERFGTGIMRGTIFTRTLPDGRTGGQGRLLAKFPGFRPFTSNNGGPGGNN